MSEELRIRAETIKQSLKAPIDSIKGYFSFLNEDSLSEFLDENIEDYHKLKQTSFELNDTVNQLLDVDKISSSENKDEIEKKIRHDIRNPLNVIIGFSEMMLEDLETDESQLENFGIIENIHSEAKSLNDQLSNLVSFSTNQTKNSSSNSSIDISKIMELIDTKKNTKEPITSATFLIVDDNDSNRNFLKQFLKRQSHQVLEASNGKIACNLLNKESSIEIVLLDMIMPEMNGFEVLSFMKNSPVFKDIPVIMISGLQESELVTKCIEAGADDYLSKPFNSTILNSRIKSCIEKKRLRDKELSEIKKGRRIQAAMMPNILPSFVKAINYPAKNISGDFYDVVSKNENSCYFILADVSGKGVHAGMLMSKISSIFSYITGSDTDVSIEYLTSSINHELQSKSFEGMFATAVIGYCDEKTFRFCNAGHEPILCVKNNNVEYFKASAPPLGIVDKSLFVCKEEVIQINQPMKLAIYTDGVTEGYLENGKMLEASGVEEIFINNDCNNSIEKIKNLLIYSNNIKLHDDITLLGFEFLA